MHENRSHPLLAQLPLTVSPFISLPSATTLSYTYKTIPSTLPPSSTASSSRTADDKQQYVVSTSGHAAHPDEIIASCQALQAHLQKMQDDADKELQEWEERIKERELAEKRRVAPGWLDSDARILEPARKQGNIMDADVSSAEAATSKTTAMNPSSDGDELDRAFGGLNVKS